MGILDLFRSSPKDAVEGAGVRADAEGFWGYSLQDPELLAFLQAGRATNSGAVVTSDTALRNMAVFRCVDIIASSIGSLPFYLLRRSEDGKLEPAEDHPLHDLLLYEPNNFQSPFDFKSYMQANALVEGDAYALIIRSRGRVLRLVPLEPGKVSWKQNADWSITYSYRRATGAAVEYGQSDILHLRGLSRNGIGGLSRTTVASEAIGVALQAERASARLFRNGMLAGGLLSHPKTLSDAAIARLKAGLKALSGADRTGEWVVGEEGLDLKPFPTTAVNAQMAETRKLQIEEVARAFGVPRPLLMMDDTSWGSGIEQLGILFVRFGLSPWFKVWEEATARACLTLEERRRGLRLDFDERELLRGSMKDQGEFYARALGAGGHRPWMSQNEVRDVVGLGRSDDPEAERLSNPMTQRAGLAGGAAGGSGDGAA